MNVTIIGAGRMARGIGARLLGHAGLQILDRNPARAQSLAVELGGEAGQLGRVPIQGEMVVLAVPYPALPEVTGLVADQLEGRIVVDISNPVDFTSMDGLLTPPGSSAAEELAKRLPRCRVVKAFNTTFAGTLTAGAVGGQPLDVLIASDDSGAAKTLAELVEAGGLRPVQAGPLRRARELEAAGFLHISVQEPLNGRFGTALKIVS